MLLTIVTPEQFDALYQALPAHGAQLMVESGLRWGELAELRPRDLDTRTRMLTVSRVQVELSSKFHHDGGRFMVRDYPRGKKHRRLKLGPQLVAKLTAHAERHSLVSGGQLESTCLLGKCCATFQVGKYFPGREATMADSQQPQPTGTEATTAEAAAALAEIQRRQGKVIKAVLVPGWYWWAMAAGMVAIGAARDTGDLLAQAIAIPLAALVMAGLTGAMIPAVRRRVQVYSSTQPDGRGAAAIFGLILLVDGAILGTAASLHAARVPYPGTIGTAAGAAVLVIAGPLVNRYLRGLMLSHARQQMNAEPEAGATP